MGLEGAHPELMSDWEAVGFGTRKSIGILLVHGFTGSPAAMRPWANFLHSFGYTVNVPLLPGHGTRPEDLNFVKWQEWPAKVESELNILLQNCEKVFIFGLSMGGGTTLNIAARYSSQLAGIVLVNPMIHYRFLHPQILWCLSRFKKLHFASGSDIKRPGVSQYKYDFIPLIGVYELLKMLRVTRKQLSQVSTPIQLFHSTNDHTLPVSNTEIILRGVGSIVKDRIELANSYHVATLDYDAELIYESSKQFIEAHS